MTLFCTGMMLFAFACGIALGMFAQHKLSKFIQDL